MNGLRQRQGKSVDDLCRNMGCDHLCNHPHFIEYDEEDKLDGIEARLPTALIPKSVPLLTTSVGKEEPPPPIPILNHKNKNIYNETDLKPENMLITSQ